jgi:hypothetical protein
MNISNFIRGGSAVTPSNTTLLPLGLGLYVGGAGDVAVTCEDGSQFTFSAVPAGTFIPVRVTQVRSTGTDATLIIALR